VSTLNLDASPVGLRGARRPGALGVTIVAVVAALLLLTASGFKVAQWVQESNAAASALETTGREVAGPGVLGLLWPIAEIVIAFGIFWFRRHAWVWALATLMFGGFAGYTFLLMTRGAATCGCFGDFGPEPWVMFTVDTLMMLICAGIATQSWGFRGFRGVVLTLAGAGAVTGASVAGATTAPPPDARLDPVAQLKQLSVMDDVNEASRRSPYYLVYVYAASCPRCQQHYPGMRAFADATRDHPQVRGKLLEITDLQALGEAEGVELPRYAWTHTPTTLLMRNGSVIEEFDQNSTPDPGDVFERLTGADYADFLATAPLPDRPATPPRAPGADDDHAGHDHEGHDHGDQTPGDQPSGARAPAGGAEAGAVIDKLRGVTTNDESRRFAEIFDDEPGGVRHLLYAHTNCGVCIGYRKDMLEVQDLVSDRLKIHPVMIELLEDDGIAAGEWGGVHAAALLDGGELVEWFPSGSFGGDLPVELYDQIPAE